MAQGLIIGLFLGAILGFFLCALLTMSKAGGEAEDMPMVIFQGKTIAKQAERIRELEQLVGALEESNEKLAIEVAQRTFERDTLTAEHARAMEQLRELDRELARIRNWQEQYEKAKGGE